MEHCSTYQFYDGSFNVAGMAINLPKCVLSHTHIINFTPGYLAVIVKSKDTEPLRTWSKQYIIKPTNDKKQVPLRITKSIPLHCYRGDDDHQSFMRVRDSFCALVKIAEERVVAYYVDKREYRMILEIILTDW